jgi:hypothetical protein
MKFLILLLFMPIMAFAQVDPGQAADVLKPVLEIALAYLPTNVLAALILVGGLRVVFKPLMMFLEALTLYTPSKKDDKLYSDFKNGNVYKWLVFLIDYIASIKLPIKK